jgi:branched-chain amino acid aminotransferase
VNSPSSKRCQSRGFDEALVLNQDGHISEGPAANVFMLRNGCGPRRRSRTTSWKESRGEASFIACVRTEVGCVERSIDRRKSILREKCSFAGTGVQMPRLRKWITGMWEPARWGHRLRSVKKYFMDVVHGRNAKYRERGATPIYEESRTGRRRSARIPRYLHCRPAV